MGMTGWIKLHRELMQNGIFQNEKLLKVFIYCLLKASHSNHTVKVGRQSVDLKPGQFVFGRKKAASDLDMKESTVRDYMNVLKDDSTITMSSTNKYTVVTIDKWAKYQQGEQKDDSKYDSETTDKKTTEGQQTDTYKNEKNEKNEKKKSKRRKYIYDDVHLRAAKYLEGLIQQNVDDFQAKNIETWANEIRLLNKQDNKDLKRISQVMDYAQTDSFWKGVVLSGKSLRDNFEQLNAQMTSRSGKSNVIPYGRGTSQERIANMMEGAKDFFEEEDDDDEKGNRGVADGN